MSLFNFLFFFSKYLQRKEANAVSARNVELTQLVVDFQKRLRESSNSVQEAEEIVRKLSIEVG